MTKLLEEKELAEIRERDDEDWATPCVGTVISMQRRADRRALLSHVEALEAELAAVNLYADGVKEECSALSQRLAAAERRVAELENAQLRAVGQMQVDLHEIVKLRSSLQLAEINAARYEWLRDHWDEPEVAKLHPWDEFSPDPDQLDAQIDSALSSQEQKCETCGGDRAVTKKTHDSEEFIVDCPRCSPSATSTEKCETCGAEIDPDTCGCGSPMSGGYHDNHHPIPMGCNCFRATSTTGK